MPRIIDRNNKIKWLLSEEALKLWDPTTFPTDLKRYGWGEREHKWLRDTGKSLVQGLQRAGLVSLKTNWIDVRIMNLCKSAVEVSNG